MQNNAAIAQSVSVGIVVERAGGVGGTIPTASSKKERGTSLEIRNGTNRPATHDLIEDTILPKQWLPMTKLQIKGTVYVECMSYVEERRPISQTHVSES